VDPHVRGARDAADHRQLGHQGVQRDLLVHRCRGFVARRAVEVHEGGHEQAGVAVGRCELGDHLVTRLRDQSQGVTESPGHLSQRRRAVEQVAKPLKALLGSELVGPGQPCVELGQLLGRGVGEELSDRAHGIADRLEPAVIRSTVPGHLAGHRQVLDQPGLELLVREDLVGQDLRRLLGDPFQPAVRRPTLECLPDQLEQPGCRLLAWRPPGREEVEWAGEDLREEAGAPAACASRTRRWGCPRR
jgi:hypothetical protein